MLLQGIMDFERKVSNLRRIENPCTDEGLVVLHPVPTKYAGQSLDSLMIGLVHDGSDVRFPASRTVLAERRGTWFRLRPLPRG